MLSCARASSDDKPGGTREAINGYLGQLKKTQPQPDGLLVCAMELTLWPDVHHLAQNRGDLPTVVYSNLTSFTGHMRATRKLPKTYVGATQDVGWLAYGLRMLGTIWRMKNTRLAVLVGNETKDVTVMKLQGPEAMILGSGKVVSNIAQPPSGCCRTAVEVAVAVDGVADSEDCKGFHQLFILGNLQRDFAAYCQLAGIQSVHV
jgi:hypothetical protein